MEDDELQLHRLASGKCRSEETQHGEVSEHAGIDVAAAVAGYERVTELQIEQVGRIDSGIEAGERLRFCVFPWNLRTNLLIATDSAN